MSLQNACTHVLKFVNNILKCANNTLCCVCYIHTGMAFTCSNVLIAVRPVEDWWGKYSGLGCRLYISEDKRTVIRETYSDPDEQKRQLILYWITTDPLASWRRLIRELDRMSQSPVADAIRDYAEPLAGAICNVMSICCYLYSDLQCSAWQRGSTSNIQYTHIYQI